MASHGVNKVILVGRVGQDPEIRYLPDGGAVANLSLATSESWKDKNTGEIKEKTEWHRITIWGKLAEICGEYVKKGTQLYVEGKLQTRKYQAQDGTDRYVTEVVLNIGGVMQMLGGKPQNTTQSAAKTSWGQPQQPTTAPAHSGPASPTKKGGSLAQNMSKPPAQNEPPMDFDDNIPF